MHKDSSKSLMKGQTSINNICILARFFACRLWTMAKQWKSGQGGGRGTPQKILQ